MIENINNEISWLIDENFQYYLHSELDLNIEEELRDNLDINHQDVLAAILKVVLINEISN
jgi:hypothetical protein